jgi:hypothetical protein
MLIRMHGRMVGTRPDAFASGGFAHPTNRLGRTRHSYPPLPPRGKSAATFPLIRGIRDIPLRQRIRREKAGACRMKKRAAVLPSVRRNEIA